jgi:predicted ATPase
VLWGLWAFYLVRAEHKEAHELAEQLLHLAQTGSDSALLVEAHYAVGLSLAHLGELAPARPHLEHGSALYDAQQHHSLAFSYGSFDPGVACLTYRTEVLWLLGYPDQALKTSHEGQRLAHDLSHPFSLAFALTFAVRLHQLRREAQAAQGRTEEVIALSTERGFPFFLAEGTIFRGWALAEQGHLAEGLKQIHENLAAWRAIGADFLRPHFLALLAEAYGQDRQVEEGLGAVVEGLAFVESTEERYYEAELYRLKGELLLKQSHSNAAETEACFLQAIAIAQRQPPNRGNCALQRVSHDCGSNRASGKKNAPNRNVRE